MGDDGRVNPLTGHLLIAGPSLFDPNFRRAVVLVGHHDDEGAVGVILNRSLEVSVREAVPPLAELVEAGEPIFSGGPVEPGGVIVLADFVDPSVAEVIALGSIGFLPPEGPEDLRDGIRRARVFAGYAGWGAGQLEEELADDDWILEPAVPGDVFHHEPARLWDDVLRRKGRDFDMLRLMPVDPSLN
jgi:putative transcriptional regulator